MPVPSLDRNEKVAWGRASGVKICAKTNMWIRWSAMGPLVGAAEGKQHNSRCLWLMEPLCKSVTMDYICVSWWVMVDPELILGWLAEKEFHTGHTSNTVLNNSFHIQSFIQSFTCNIHFCNCNPKISSASNYTCSSIYIPFILMFTHLYRCLTPGNTRVALNKHCCSLNMLL